MDWQLLMFLAILAVSLVLLTFAKSAIGEGKPGPRDHSSVHEAEAAIRARGGPGPG